MGTKGREIVGMDIEELLTLLNKAFADEWLAYYQYWLGAKVAKGPMKEGLIAELLQHATDELRHADLVANRIVQLGGEPVATPQGWYENTNCGYDAPTDPYVRVLLEQNIKGEQCAIGVYQALAQKTRDADPVTYEMAVQILNDEVEHEEDLQSLLEDLDLMASRH
ncbi:MAG: ferritin-like domain-containing protein [Candidatus Hydrogenedentes bacterium]|nr:ferritin-like domain-containing protein [Candidatus Hydrogenedentota bacterium]